MVNDHYRWDFIGLSTDEKPTPETSEKVVDGSTFYCSDTSKLYVYCEDDWYEKKPLGGSGGGGTTYTAGNGIDITDDTISVDTDVIQEKLTAGENITIEDGTISASGGGSSVNVVQTIGTSTTDVMSQDASTKLITQDATNQNSVSIISTQYGANTIAIGKNATAYQSGAIAIGSGSSGTSSAYTTGLCSIAIGQSSRARGNYGITIGNDTNVQEESISLGHQSGVGSTNQSSAKNNVYLGHEAGRTSHNYHDSVALGHSAQFTRNGEVNIGAGSTTNGFNSTSYRVLGGVHDGQDAHDAVTVSQVNSVIDAINTALNTSIPHIGVNQ